MKPKLAISVVLFVSWVALNCSSNSTENTAQPPGADLVMLEADNPKITDIVEQVDLDSLKSTIATLVGFFTRHTNSDTLSETEGIGAARRWVFNKFQNISQENGGRLKVSFHTFEATIRGVTGRHRNVVAELPGTVTPEKKYLVSGHLDSRNRDLDDAVNFAPGANDDGSGVAAVLELARIFSQFEFESTVIFVAFTGEEEGLFGSRALARALRQENVDIAGMVTNDIIGNIVGGSGKVDSLSVRCFSDEPTDSPSRQLARYIKAQGEAYLPGFTVNLIPNRDRPGRGGDHFGFNEQGYPAARLTEPEDNLQHQHNMDDLPEFMAFSYFTRVVKVNAAYLASLADAPKIPLNVQVSVLADGQRKITWDQPQPEKVVDYLVAFRSPGAVNYEGLISAGNVNEFLLDSNRVSSFPIYVSISAVDRAANESVFSKEVLIEP
ncbi:MAG: M20/M25/M40 family metallo-hydrolase [bacterium]